MADDLMRRLAGEQRRRFVAAILGAAEQSPWWSRLSVTEQRAHREKVLVSVGSYHDFMLDVIKVTNDDGVRNEHAISLLTQVHESQRRVERDARSRAPAGPA